MFQRYPDAPLSRKILDGAEKFQASVGESRLGRYATRKVTGCPSPAYRQLQWRKQPHAHPDETQWVHAPGDPKAARVLRSKWRHALILAVAATDVAEFMTEHPKSTQAVTYRTAHDVRVGTLQEEADLFQPLPNNPRLLAVALRHGREDTTASMGFTIPELSGSIVLPVTVRLLTAQADIADFTQNYPGVRIG